MEDVRNKPAFSLENATDIASSHFGINGVATPLPGGLDQNFRITGASDSYVIKIANPDTELKVLELENAAIQLASKVDSLESPMLIRAKAGSSVVALKDAEQRICYARCLSFLPGVALAKFPSHSKPLLNEIGRLLGRLDHSLARLNSNPTGKRQLKWDLANAESIVLEMMPSLTDSKQALLQCFMNSYQRVAPRIGSLRKSTIHNDANDYNILVHHDPVSDLAMIGLIDFGDLVYSTLVNELAICGAYVMLGKENPLEAATALVAGYQQTQPLDEDELSVLFPLMCMRLCQSVCIAAEQQNLQPENEYLGISEKPAWETLQQLATIAPAEAHLNFSDASADVKSLVSMDVQPIGPLEAAEILRLRKKHISPSLSLAYDKSLHIVRGHGQYLYDPSDVTYLDCVNNVCHVGHCRPEVIRAADDQMKQLNTNTRFLHENIVRYALRLTETLPDPLEVCYFVNSGSEANDLALRLARAYTHHHDVIVLDHAYHGHVSSMIELSPYKFNRAGGSGKSEHVHVAPAPDGFRGQFKSDDPDYGKKYAGLANQVIDQAVADGRSIAAFFAESLMGCGGQVPLPNNFLQEVYQHIRNVGGVSVADEVQVGFGRVGTHFWGFERQGVVPDIVTMGKPIGNGHPLAAVVTTREIADAFNNGMEYFNTFGGNPVSCAVGMAVLDVIEKEDLQNHALKVGDWLLDELGALMSDFDSVGDVRGSGLFLGVELVKNRETLTPATELAKAVVERMKHRRILLSTDGPYENVIKFKPPMVFSQGDAERLVMTIRQTLGEMPSAH